MKDTTTQATLAAALAAAQSLAATLATVPTVGDAVVNYVTKMGRVGFSELFETFGPENVCAQRARKSFIELLRCLASSHKIAIHGRQDKGYSLDNLVISLPEAATPSDSQETPVPIRTRAPQYDVMHGDAYVHVLAPPTRAGALNFKRFATKGVRC